MSVKLTEHIRLNLTYEMRDWLDRIAAEGGTDRSAVIRSMLQAIMDDDLRENEVKAA